jgi:nicotinate phosphoribosyltransferase
VKRPRRELQRSATVSYVPKDDGQNGDRLKPLSTFVSPLLTDMYQITMAYSLWKNNRHEIPATFDLFFRKNPFGGEFTVFAGLEEVVRFVSDFHFKPEQIEHIKAILPHCDAGFFEWLEGVDCSNVKIMAIQEGSVVFPKVPLIIVEGPIGVCQLLETTLLCLVNFASLVATNAARHRLAVGKDKVLLEFGLRRAQGPDGAVSASRYAYLGGCNGTSNVLAYCLFGIPIKGTHAHSYVTSFSSQKDLTERELKGNDGIEYDLWEEVIKARNDLDFHNTNEGELVAFTAYARTFPNSFLALIDTYDTLNSGLLNFVIVALALHRLGYKALGVRLDSGDLAYLSKEARKILVSVGEKYKVDYFKSFQIVASNDLNEQTINSLNRQGHEIDVFAVGTNLVTCQAQPALGCVYKLVEIDGSARIKLSQEASKVSLPGRKVAYRLFSSQEYPLVDLLVPVDTKQADLPKPGERYLCLHPFEEQKRVYVTPARVEALHNVVWDGKVTIPLPTLEESRALCQTQIARMREDHLRQMNPTPYKVSVNKGLYDLLHGLWLASTPIRDLA